MLAGAGCKAWAQSRRSRPPGAADLTSGASVARPTVIAAELRRGAGVVLMRRILAHIARVEVAGAGRAAHEMFGCSFGSSLTRARDTCGSCATSSGHIVARARESSCACFRAMECRSARRASRPRISNSTRRRGPGRCEPCEFLMLSPRVEIRRGGRSKRHTNSPHPSSREGHHSTAGWSSTSSYRV